MADLRSELKAELSGLVMEGKVTLYVEQVRSDSDNRAELNATLANARKRFDALKQRKKKEDAKREFAHLRGIATRVEANDFATRYQSWYSKALPIVEQVLPDRYREFRDLHRLEKRPKELDVTTYTIDDYLQGTTVTRGTEFYKEDVFDSRIVAFTRFKSQIDILNSAADRLDSRLVDLTGVVEAGLLDDELESSRELLKAKYLRAAGVVAGVVLERHLKRLITNHGVTFRKQSQLGNLNDALKAAGVYDVAQWRRIQHLADIRNLCGHDADREPSHAEVSELIGGTETVVTTVF